MSNDKIAVVGAGLSGTLMAIRLAQLGYTVDLIERRSDMRQQEVDAGRSINLALSARGLAALDMIGLRQELQDDIIPMYGRRIHPLSGPTSLYKYSGRADEYINSISRAGLNIELLNCADRHPNITSHFDTKSTQIDYQSSSIDLRLPDGSTTTRSYDVILAADGAGSSLRKSFQRHSNRLRFDFQQHYLDTGYKELSIPPGPDGTWLIDPNALHIWPRDGHMMIALPNTDRSFTVTLFIRFEGPDSLGSLPSDEAVINFFDRHYPDALVHMPTLIQDWHDNPSSSLGFIKCHPWLQNRSLLLGDAAHAIVPFYGQGMNCAFEDCVVLDRLIAEHNYDWDLILPAYQNHRKVDADAICDLAIDNFYEMRDGTADPIFNRKRKIELRLEQEYPDYYSKYGLVTFRPDLRYHEAMNLGRKQDEVLIAIAAQTPDAASADMDAIYAQVLALQH